MTEITRVPLQPIAKGTLTKLWLGVGAAALAAAGLAWATLPAGIKIETLTAGSGPSPTIDDVTLINYKGTLAATGKEFDSGEKAVLPVEGSVPGFQQALEKMQKGGKYRIHIPADLAYGAKGAGPIPPNSDLDFEVELLDFKSRAEIEQQQAMMQQLQQLQAQQQQQGGAQAAPDGAVRGMPPGAPQPR